MKMIYIHKYIYIYILQKPWHTHTCMYILKRRLFLKNIRSLLQIECCCLYTVNDSNVCFTKKTYICEHGSRIRSSQYLPMTEHLTMLNLKQEQWWLNSFPWRRHQIETFFALLAICAGNSPVPGEFPAQRPVTRSLDVFFYLRLNKRLSKQSWGWWFEKLPRPLWRHCNASKILSLAIIPYHMYGSEDAI